MLKLDGATVIHNRGTPAQIVALDEVDVEVPRGQFVTLVGSNGAGKSTLIKVVAGVIKLTSGSVQIGDTDVTGWPDHRRSALISHVFDNPTAGTMPELSIEENMAIAMSRGQGRYLRRASNKKRRMVMRTSLESLGLGLENRLSDRVELLSAGQRQSLTLAMATLAPTSILLLDEHVAALDPVTQERVINVTINTIERSDAVALMVTHDMSYALKLGDRLLVLRRGSIVADLSAAEKRTMTVDALVSLIEGRT